MSLPTVCDKLQIREEKNVLIQGLPSSIEKQFAKLTFAKSVTPLLRSRRIDFALVFAVSKRQLDEILCDVVPALHPQGKLWVAYPKPTSKIASDLCRDPNWEIPAKHGFAGASEVVLDGVWCALRFQRMEIMEPEMAG
jgi:hypothetical protein